jgi:branched-chain amino acid transport system substrate-binding protein
VKDSLGGDVEIIIQEKYEIVDDNLRTPLLKIANTDADAILMFGFGPAFPAVFKEKKELGIDIPIYATDAISSPYYFEVAGGYDVLEGVHYSATAFTLEESAAESKLAEFMRRYMQKTGEQSSFFSGYAYDTMMLTLEAMKACPGANAEELRGCLLKQEIDGLLGATSFDEDQEIKIPLFVKKFTDEGSVVVKEYGE